MAHSIEIPEEYNSLPLQVYLNDEIVEKEFKLNELLAICTKGYYEPYSNNPKGGVLVFVKGEEEPYLTSDAINIHKIIGRLEQNPFGKQIALIQKGTPNLRVLEDAYKETPKYIVLKSGAKLLIKEAARK